MAETAFVVMRSGQDFHLHRQLEQAGKAMPAVVDYLERQAAIVTGQHHSLLQARRIDDPAANTVNALLQRGGYLQAKFQHASARCGRQRDAAHTDLQRSEERRVGKEWVSTGRSRWSPYN